MQKIEFLEYFAFKILQILNAALPSFHRLPVDSAGKRRKRTQTSCALIRRGRLLSQPPGRFERKKSQTALTAIFLFLATLQLFSTKAFPAMTVSEFGQWELAHGDKKFTLSTKPLNARGVSLKLDGAFSTPFAKMPENLRCSIHLAGSALEEFDEDKSERCVIFVDGIKYIVHIKRQGSTIDLEAPELGPALFASRHENFVIGFPTLAVSWTFPVGGLAQAFNRVRVLQEQMGISAREESRKTFGMAGSVVIVCAALLGFCLMIWRILRHKSQTRAQNSHAQTRPEPENEKARSAQAKKFRFNKSREQRQKDYRAEAGRAYKFQAQSGSRSAADDFFEKANFGAPFAHSASLPPEVIKAFEFFGLPQNATFMDARKKRNFMLKAYHPDRFENDAAARAEAEEETKLINYNFDILEKHFGR